MRLVRSFSVIAFAIALAACSTEPTAVEAQGTAPQPAPSDTPAPSPAADAEKLDPTDIEAFDRLALAVRTSKAAADKIFVELANNQRYEFHKLPVYWLRRSATGKNERGYLVGFPSPQGKRVEHAALVDLAPVHRWDDDVNVLPADAPFSFEEPVAGAKAFVFPYRPESDEPFDPALPSSPEFFAMLVHEGFHRYQTVEAGWTDPPGWTQDEASYPLTRDNVALALLENRVLVAGLTAKDVAAKENALKQVAAIRAARVKLPSVVVSGVNFVEKLDLPQELVEGTADYTEIHFREAAADLTAEDAKKWRVERLEMLFEKKLFESMEDVRVEFAFGRFYSTGSALGQLLDDVNAGDWQSQCKKAISQYQSVVAKYPTAIAADADALVTAAKTAHEYDAKILPYVDTLLALPKGAPQKFHRANHATGCRHPH